MMATQQTHVLGRALLTPAVALLFIWMIVPLAMTIYFATLHYSLLAPGSETFVGLQNFRYFLTDPAFLTSLQNTLVLVGSVLAITILVGTHLALLLDQPVIGRSIVRLMVIAPFFVMPTVSALVWKNLLMHPVSGLFAWGATLLGKTPIDWFTDAPLFAVILIVAWEWLLFATLMLRTALQSQDEEQKEAAEMDGAGAVSKFIYLTLPHLARPITVVILIETIFLLTVFAEIFVTTGGGPGLQTTNIAFLIYSQALIQFDVGNASAGGLVAVVIANIVAFFLVRIIGRNLGAEARARGVSGRRVVAAAGGAWFFGFLVFFPNLWMILTSFKTELEAFAMPPSFLLFHWTTENYATVQERSDYVHHALNSIIVAGGSTLIAMLIAIPAAWSMAFAPTKRTKDVLLWMLSTKMMPPVGVVVPIYLIYRDFGLLDTRAGLVFILCLGNLPIVIWMLFTYFKEIPKDILEAARMDGATIGRELVYGLAPMAVPGLASRLLLNFILAWNEAFWTLNLSTLDAAPLTVFIASYSSPEGLFWAKLSAASTLAIAPIIILGWFTQRQLVRGLTFGAVK